MKSLLACALTLWLSGVLTGALTFSASAQSIQVTFRGVTNLGTSTTDQNSTAFTVGGLSGITYQSGNDYLAVMDNSNKLVKLNIALNANGSINTAALNGGLTLIETRDFEGVAYTNPGRNSVFISEENTPAIHEYSLANGSNLQSLTSPPIYTGVNLRPNFGFESLTRGSGDMWTANEEALVNDGDRSTQSTGSTVRLHKQAVSGNTVTPGAQYAYVTDPIHATHSDADRSNSRSGLADLLELPDGRLIALERSFAFNGLFSTFRNSLYEITLSGATDISGSGFDTGLIGKSYTPVTEQLLWQNTGVNILNLEGIALGPQLGPNRYAILGIVDNQNNGLFPNSVVAFEAVIPEPASCGALAGLAMLLRRNRRAAN